MNNEEEKRPHLLPDEVKWSIICKKKQGLGNKAIAREVGASCGRPTLSHQTVKLIWEKYTETGQVGNNWNTEGRPTVITAMETEELINYCIENRNLSCNELKRDLNLQADRKTINNVLVKNGYKSYVAPQKLPLTSANITKRRIFAQEHLRWTVEDDWSRIVYSDECKFPLIVSNGRLRVRRRADEMLEEDMIQHHDDFSDEILVWGTMSYDGLGKVVRVEGTIKGKDYLRVIRYRIGRRYSGLYTGENIYMHDNARPHVANIVKDWFEQKDIEVLDWPAQSPDLNIIEDIWNMLKYRMRGEDFEDLDEVWKRVEREWNAITVEEVRSIYDSLPRRMRAVRDAQGAYTKY